jgi:hypothetical protein
MKRPDAGKLVGLIDGHSESPEYSRRTAQGFVGC